MKRTSCLLIAPALMLLSLMLYDANPVHAEPLPDPAPTVYLDGLPLKFQVPPVIEDGYSLVPLRPIFEAQGAKVNWDPDSRTVTAVKEGTTLTYRIGATDAYKNNDRLDLPVPGQIVDGFTMVPLRFVSEALGNLVKWHDYSRSITISSARGYETGVEYGVNLRVAPGKTDEATVVRMLPKGERIHVIREMDADWLEVQTQDLSIGFISAKPLYTDYASPTLARLQADALIAYGARYLGTPYDFGASPEQTDTFDCSSFVKRVFKDTLNIELPRVSYDQAKEGTEVAVDELREGDLMFFEARGLDIGHVGIYAGDNRILHTYSEKLGVHFAQFEGQWKERFVTARRLF
ncbi:stalk domain-containing protein [Cohnella sp. GCM10027633]|uniref:stalk domain-containing protein n=1 Tax=unclassified Cohnella TaxID=2636738 RepID=UPI00363BAB25